MAAFIFFEPRIAKTIKTIKMTIRMTSKTIKATRQPRHFSMKLQPFVSSSSSPSGEPLPSDGFPTSGETIAGLKVVESGKELGDGEAEVEGNGVGVETVVAGFVVGFVVFVVGFVVGFVVVGFVVVVVCFGVVVIGLGVVGGGRAGTKHNKC